MTFANAIQNQKTVTTNGMVARVSTANACVDFFFAVGGSRGKNIVPQLTAALVENRDLALRIVQWARDVRGGAGERDLFRQMMKHLEVADPAGAESILKNIPEIGRFDDLLVFQTTPIKVKAFSILGNALRENNGLAAKWSPRQGPVAAELRAFFGMSPKQYRKTLVNMTKVVESQMCENDWDNINYSHVPSLAHARYKKAFGRHSTTYADFIKKLSAGDPTVKVNAGAIFPHDVIKGMAGRAWSTDELALIKAQWEALPNYLGDAKVLPMVDVSGSMTCKAGQKGTVTCMDVAVSLGLYMADKNTGVFKDCMLTFSESPQLVTLKGNINQKINQMVKTKWGMNTNLNKALDLVLSTAVNANLPQKDMPEMLVIFSDMQFDQCVMNRGNTAFDMIRQKYEAAGYKMPALVFWNLNWYGNVPVKFDQTGTALVSGFSPTILTAVLSGDTDTLSPEGVMLRAVMNDRYAV